jgi:hypothetical protein
MHLLCVSHGFSCRAHIGFGDDFQQRCAGTVQVDTGHILEITMQ